MRFRGARRSAYAVPPCAAAQQDNHISRPGSQPLHRASGRRSQNRADLHALCHIIRVIDFLHITRRKSYLVSIGTVAVRSFPHQLFLRKFARNRIFHRRGRIRRPRHTHRLIHIGTPGERIPDRTAKTRRRTAERLNFCRMVMRLVFKIDQPFLRSAVHLDRNDNRARVDLVGLLLIIELSFFFKTLHCHQGDIHQTDILIPTVTVQTSACVQIIKVCTLDRRTVIPLVKCHIL